MRVAVFISRVALGLIFLVFGLNGFYTFIPAPPMSDSAMGFMDAMMATGYMVFFWKSIEVIGGVLLLANVYVPFALVILAPVVSNIFFFHLFLEQASLFVGVLVLALEVFLIWAHRAAFLPLLSKRSAAS